MKKKIVILGPTGVGKTDIAINIAENINAEIISADSMQIYKGMDIGTGKADKIQLKKINHHLIDIVEPGTNYNVSDYILAAKKEINSIEQRNKNVIITGGTGLYVKGLLMGILQDDENTIHERLNVENDINLKGLNFILDELKKNDPEKFNELNHNDIKRIVRAVSFFRSNKIPLSKAQKEWKKPIPSEYLLIGLNLHRSLLYEKINNRVDKMMQKGFMEEVKELIKKNINKNSTCWQAIGYKHLFEVINLNLDLNTAIELIKRDSRHYAKRQLTWFSKVDNINWFDVSNISDCTYKILTLINSNINK